MGSRGRSIRLRIYFLVAIPLITMLGLFGYVAYSSVTNWLNLDRAPSLIRATSIPLTNFVSLLQAERRAAIVYESRPTAASLAAYQATVTATKNGVAAFEQTIHSSATTQNATASSTAAMAKMAADVSGLSGLRAEVAANKISPISTLEAYSEIVADQDNVFQAQAASMTDSSASSQGLGLISAVNAREDLSEQDAVLAGALAANSLTGPDRAAFGQAAGRQFDDTQLYQRLLTPAELTSFTNTMNQLAPPATIQASLTKVQDGVEAGIPLAAMKQQGLSPVTWRLLTSTWSKANYAAATDAATTTLAADQGLADSAKHRVWVTAGVGLAGLILTLLVTILLAQSINRRLAGLRKSALTLAQEQLPAVVARLRRGEQVDVAAEAPPLRAGQDEIGQVGEAIDTVRQTAIRSAVEEAKVRQGVNDMFRNLARRNQSLLQRQLTVLDEMERRATDPDVLEDLFKMDHLTTRMRRHAEGLIILSGAPPGRSWSAPVKLVDVMRGAVAEVEDYARVLVSTQSRAALAGSAVTDVIHLLAELIENATTLSPPFTQVRVAGELVANGFAIEIEDRGLGMVPQRMQELNERLANPPDINPANTEQLGLFVVGQLARRHGIRVMLRPSPYGGTTAIALIPPTLVGEDGPAAITAGGLPADSGAGAPGAPGAPAVGAGANGSYGNPPYGGGANGGALNGGALNGGGANGGALNGGALNGGALNGGGFNGSTANGTAGYPGAAVPAAGDGTGGGQPPWTSSPGWPDGVGQNGLPQPGDSPYSTPAAPVAPAGYGNGIPAPAGAGAPAPAVPASEPDALPRRSRRNTEEVPVVTGVPVGQPFGTPPPAAGEPSFDVFTPLRRSEPERGPAPGGAPYPVPGGDPYPAASPLATSPAAAATGADYRVAGAPGTGGGVRAGLAGPPAVSGDQAGAADPDGESSGLPRRVRQASLAPQLRASAAGPNPSPGVPPATAASLTDMRNTLSAMQRGWQQGRSQPLPDSEGEPADGH